MPGTHPHPDEMLMRPVTHSANQLHALMSAPVQSVSGFGKSRILTGSPTDEREASKLLTQPSNEEPYQLVTGAFLWAVKHTGLHSAEVAAPGIGKELVRIWWGVQTTIGKSDGEFKLVNFYPQTEYSPERGYFEWEISGSGISQVEVYWLALTNLSLT